MWAAVSVLQWGCQSSNYKSYNPLLCSLFYSISSLTNMKVGKKHKGWLCWQAPLTSTALRAKRRRRGSGRRNEEPTAAVASLGLLSPGEVKHGVTPLPPPIVAPQYRPPPLSIDPLRQCRLLIKYKPPPSIQTPQDKPPPISTDPPRQTIPPQLVQTLLY